MPTGLRRHRVVALVLAAFLAALVLAATAAAETKIGESSSPFNKGAPSPETTIVKGSASYETTSGAVRFDITTAAPPQTKNESGEKSESTIFAALISMPGECSIQGFTAIESSPVVALPFAEIVDQYSEPTAWGAVIFSAAVEPTPLPATKALSGTTTTLELTTSLAVEKGFNCAIVEATEPAGASVLVFPIVALPPAPPVVAPAPAPAPPPAPPAPPVFSIAKPKPLKLKVDKWHTVKVKVTNTGATATGAGSLRVKAPKGVLVKPERQKLPILAPGGSWTVSIRVELTKKAKKTSKLSLTAAASGVTGTSSLAVKLKD